MDNNSTTPGFGTLNRTLTGGTLNTLLASQSSLGTTATTGVTFSAAAAHDISFGSAATNENTTTGTISIGNTTPTPGLSSPYFRGIVFQNLTGNQTITNNGNGNERFIAFVGASPYCEVTANGKLVLSTEVRGSINWEKRGASTLQLLNANTFSAGMTISAGTVEIGNASALGTGTVTMTAASCRVRRRPATPSPTHCPSAVL